MDSCYAINVTQSGIIWVYYYNSFTLLRIDHFQLTGQWNPPVMGARCMAVSEHQVVFEGGYRNPSGLSAVDLRSLQVSAVGPVDLAGATIVYKRAYARAENLYLETDGGVYVASIGTGAMQVRWVAGSEDLLTRKPCGKDARSGLPHLSQPMGSNPGRASSARFRLNAAR